MIGPDLCSLTYCMWYFEKHLHVYMYVDVHALNGTCILYMPCGKNCGYTCTMYMMVERLRHARVWRSQTWPVGMLVWMLQYIHVHTLAWDQPIM